MQSTNATPPPAPTKQKLRDYALHHLARFAATRHGLRAVLRRKVERWAREADPMQVDIGAAKRACLTVVDEIVAELEKIGAVNDAAFAASRATKLARAGHSRQSIQAHLAQRGIDPALRQQTAPQDTEQELVAALIQARKRRIGPFAPPAPDGGSPDAERRRREEAILARAGFPAPIAWQALALSRDEAEQIIFAGRGNE